MLVNGVGDDEGDFSVVEIDFRLRNLSDVLNTSANLPHTDLIGVQDLTRRQIIEIFMAATSG